MKSFIIRAFMIIPIAAHGADLGGTPRPIHLSTHAQSHHEQKSDGLELNEVGAIDRTPTPFPTFAANDGHVKRALSEIKKIHPFIVKNNDSLKQLPIPVHFNEITPMDLMMEGLGIRDTKSNNQAFFEKELSQMEDLIQEKNREINSLLLITEEKAQQVIRLKRKACFFHVFYGVIIAILLGVNISLAK